MQRGEDSSGEDKREGGGRGGGGSLSQIVRWGSEYREAGDVAVAAAADLLSDELSLELLKMLNLLVNFDMYKIVQREGDFLSLLQGLLRMLLYDRHNIAFSATVYSHSKTIAELKQRDRTNVLGKTLAKIDVNINDFNIFAGILPTGGGRAGCACSRLPVKRWLPA